MFWDIQSCDDQIENVCSVSSASIRAPIPFTHSPRVPCLRPSSQERWSVGFDAGDQPSALLTHATISNSTEFFSLLIHGKSLFLKKILDRGTCLKFKHIHVIQLTYHLLPSHYILPNTNSLSVSHT